MIKKRKNKASVSSPEQIGLSGEKERRFADSSKGDLSISLRAPLDLELEESGLFRICVPKGWEEDAALVLRSLPGSERRLWERRFSKSCLERICASSDLTEEVKTFYRRIRDGGEG